MTPEREILGRIKPAEDEEQFGERRGTDNRDPIKCRWSVNNYGWLCSCGPSCLAAEKDAADLRAENERLRNALRPFAHYDLQEPHSCHIEGNESILWQRNKAILRLGDFRAAVAALEGK